MGDYLLAERAIDRVEASVPDGARRGDSTTELASGQTATVSFGVTR